MIFTAIGIVFLLTLGFLVITWVAWFIFLWLSKLWYEASQTNLNRTSIRDLITNSFAVPVYILCVFYRRITNRISKMKNDFIPWGVYMILWLAFGAVMWWGGYNHCYKNNFSGQAEIQATKDFDEFKTYRAVAFLRTPVDTTWRPFWDYYSDNFDDTDNAIEVFEPWIKSALKDSNDIDFKILKVW